MGMANISTTFTHQVRTKKIAIPEISCFLVGLRSTMQMTK